MPHVHGNNLLRNAMVNHIHPSQVWLGRERERERENTNGIGNSSKKLRYTSNKLRSTADAENIKPTNTSL